jgi:hypothetical protein
MLYQLLFQISMNCSAFRIDKNMYETLKKNTPQRIMHKRIAKMIKLILPF